MIPAAFRYVTAASAEEAAALLREHGDEAHVLAGGQSLIPLMKLRLASPTVLIDLSGAGLAGIALDGGSVVVGAMTSYRDVARSPIVAVHAPLLARAASLVGDPQVRNRGTIGGAVAHGDPASDVSGALMALDATVVVQGPKGRRSIPIDDVFMGFWTTSIEPDEVLVEVRIPDAAGVGWGYEKFSIRSQDWALVAVAVAGARVALVSMGERVVRARSTESALASGSSIRDAASAADAGTSPTSDLRGSAAYRRHLARTLTEDALSAAERMIPPAAGSIR